MAGRNLDTIKGCSAVVSLVAVRVWIKKMAKMIASLHLHTSQPLDHCVKKVLRFSRLKRRSLPWSQRGLRAIQVIPLQEVNAFVEEHLKEFIENYHWNWTRVSDTDPVDKSLEAFSLALGQIHCHSHISLAPVPLNPPHWISTYVQ